MNTTLTPDGAAVLFDNSPGAGVTLWYRPSSGRGAWEPVARCETECEAVEKIGVGNRRHGRWLILPTGREP